jgi:hypothetical protein
LAAAGAATLLLLVPADPAPGQVMVHRGVNPWTGHVYRNVLVRDPWTGRVRTTTVAQPWTTVRSPRVYNPWTGRTVGTGPVRNPWTGQPQWIATRPRGWW